ncbi:ArsA family ATPase [Streptomyces sp. JJ36]|uniref:ArsA family ATPase n=1 Tax=Streptomyces sp. JJ36 TaxID=2736645 RepID=UPI001F2972AE|nr:ArsA-related P-loop ATPase [Streptomyces sp. JJ36]MCF6522991.1 ArsA family ATPase [Streptomyces sp. JJ36]
MTADGPAPAGRAGGHGGRPHTVLVTGAGGAGRTTVAAASALAAARAGQRVLLLTTEDPGVPEALLDLPPAETRGSGPAATAAAPSGPRPVAVGAVPGLWAARTAPDDSFRELTAGLLRRARAALELVGTEPLDEDEITALPGAEALALLRALRAAHASGGPGAGGAASPYGPWDTVVVDLPPAPQALRLLALPEQLGRTLRRLLPPEKQAARALHPLLAQLAGVPMPAPRVYETADRWRRELAATRAVLESPGTSVRLVAEPGPLAADPLGTARAALALHGVRLGALVANRVLPADSPDPWLAGLAEQQRAALKEFRELCAPGCPGDPPALCELPHLGRAPLGVAALAELAAPLPVPGDGTEPSATAAPSDRGGADGAPSAGRLEDRLTAEGQLHWVLPLPGARRELLDLVRRGDDLLVSVGPHRRLLSLPAALRRCRVAGAALRDGELRVRFTPDPALWPRSARPFG